MKPTIEWMRQKYNELNRDLFNGALGDCELGIFTSGKGSEGGTLGYFKLTKKGLKVDRYTRQIYLRTAFGSVWVNKDNFVDVCQPKIELNGNYSGEENSFLNTLAHEMCHYYTYMRGFAPKQAHGPEFRSIGQIVCARSEGRFDIKRFASAEEMAGYELSDEIKAKREKRLQNKKANIYALFSFKNDGAIELTTTANRSLIDDIVEYNAKRSSPSRITRPVSDEIIVSNDANLIDLLFQNGYKKNMRTYRYWNVEDKPWVADVKKYDYEVVYKRDMNENKKNIESIIESVVNKFIKEEVIGDEDIDINPNMNLGVESPLENDNFLA